MPGLCGIVQFNQPGPADPASTSQLFSAMLSTLSYGRCRQLEKTQIPSGWIGSASLDTAGRSSLCQAEDVTLAIHGYLTGTGGEADDASYAHRLYMRHGAEFLRCLEGAFSLAVWDGRTRTLLLANDRLGLRPLYLAELSGALRFASEAKALLADPALPRALDQVAIASFFNFGLVLGERTFFQAIRLLPPGSLITLQNEQLKTTSYATLSYPAPAAGHSDDDYADRVARSLQAAVANSLRPDRRYGVMLSGGLDSRWIAALVAGLRPDSIAFTFGDDASDDIRIAAQVCRTLGLEHRRLALSPTYLADQAAEIVHISDGMYNVVHAHEYPAAASLKGEAEVLLGGFLGDLLFGRNIQPLTIGLRTRQAAVDYTYHDLRKSGLPAPDMQSIFGPAQAAELTALAHQALADSFSPDISHPLNLRDHQNIMQRHRRFYYMAQLLKTPYIEIVHPFCDRTVLETATSLPLSQRFMQRADRRALATAFPALAAIPWSLTSLPPTTSDWAILLQRALARSLGKRLPDSFTETRPLLRVQRRAARYAKWFRGPLRPWLEDTLKTRNTAPGLDGRAVAAMVDDHIAGRRDLTNSLGLLITFQLWTHQFWEPTLPSMPASMA
jgi:asparagine synthetase B (glutamine-hydrolysing)